MKHTLLYPALLLLAAFQVAATPSAKPARLDEKNAVDVIGKLPEVIAFSRFLEKQTHGSVSMVILCEETPTAERNEWQFYIGEDHEDHTALWNRLSINATTASVSIWDFAEDGWVPLDRWRAAQVKTKSRTTTATSPTTQAD